MQPIELLAILGRGLKEQDGNWFLTRDLEMGNESGMYVKERLPVDDNDQNCLVGGGKLNLYAGIELCREHSATLQAVVNAYGERAPYLVAAGGPSESEIAYDYLSQRFPPTERPEVIVWPRERKTGNGRSNTDQEFFNIFCLAIERGYRAVGFVTVAVHYARALLMASQHLAKPEFAQLTLQAFVSEAVLLRSNAQKYGSRLRTLHRSQAFMRTLFREQRGINALLSGTYAT